VIPGAVTGDILKVAIASQRYPGRVAELTMVDLVDRIVGLSGIFFAALCAALFCIPSLRDCLATSQSAFAIAIGLKLIILGCFGTFVLFYIFWTKPCWSKWRWLQRLAAVIPQKILAIATRLDGALELYRPRQKALLATFLLSVIIHCGCAMTIFFLGKSLHEINMSPPQYALATQMANITGIIPIAPGGVGLRDVVAAALYKNFNASPVSVCGDLPIFYTMVLLLWALIGAFIYIFSPSLKQANQSQHQTVNNNKQP